MSAAADVTEAAVAEARRLPPNEHAMYRAPRHGDLHVPAGSCAYEMGRSRLGTTWHYCGGKASMRCVIRHGSDENLLVEDYCPRHYRNAMRRTRYDVVVDSRPIVRKCNRCHGSGKHPHARGFECDRCDGSGRVSG